MVDNLLSSNVRSRVKLNLLISPTKIMPDANKRALIIGIDVYYHEGPDKMPSLNPLPPCRKDALDMYNLLSKLDYTIFSDYPLVGSNLEKEHGWVQVHRAIRDFFGQGEAGQTLLLYFSGHGLPKRQEVYLATPQVNPKEPMVEGFSLSNLTDLMNSCKSTRIVCIIDACFSGAAKATYTRYDREGCCRS